MEVKGLSIPRVALCTMLSRRVSVLVGSLLYWEQLSWSWARKAHLVGYSPVQRRIFSRILSGVHALDTPYNAS
jgi:hypothetical protein